MESWFPLGLQDFHGIPIPIWDLLYHKVLIAGRGILPEDHPPFGLILDFPYPVSRFPFAPIGPVNSGFQWFAGSGRPTAQGYQNTVYRIPIGSGVAAVDRAGLARNKFIRGFNSFREGGGRPSRLAKSIIRLVSRVSGW